MAKALLIYVLFLSWHQLLKQFLRAASLQRSFIYKDVETRFDEWWSLLEGSKVPMLDSYIGDSRVPIHNTNDGIEESTQLASKFQYLSNSDTWWLL